jgi:3-hydroxyisobutyrate dehydrogenase
MLTGMPDLSSFRIAWIGTGVMGRSMCGHLLDGGARVAVYNRTRSKADALVARGAVWADTAAAAASQADVVFTMVGFPPDVREVYFGEHGVVAAARNGMVLVDMTTTEPVIAEEIAREAARHGARALDAPVSGGDVGAKSGTLSIMVGGYAGTLSRVRPLLEVMGKTIVHEGGPGAGQHTKMCNQIVIAGTMIGVCESLLYGTKAGLDLETMLSSIRGGAAGCWALDNLAPRIVQGNFDPGFFVEHFVKDMGIALDEAARMQLPLPGLALVRQLYLATAAQGHGRLGTQALYLALRQMAGMGSVRAAV